MIPWDFFIVTALFSLIVSYLTSGFLLARTASVSKKGIRQKPPLMGGVVVFFTLAAAFGLLYTFYNHLFDVNLRKLYGVALASALIFLLGYIDDKKPLHYSVKLAGQLLVACIIPLAGFQLDFVTQLGGGSVDVPSWFGSMVIIGWLVFMMNAVNLIDGLDGLAAGVIALACYTIFILCWSANIVIAAGALALAFALLGLLPFNSYPARFFLGDSGSLLIGFLVGLFSLFFQVKTYAAVVILLPLFILFVPILNTLLVVVKRLRRGRNPLKGDIFHLHYRLLRQGLSHQATVIFLWGVTASLCVLVVLRSTLPFRPRTLVFLSGVLVIYTLLVQLFLGILKERRQARRGK